MGYKNLRQCVEDLERTGQLVRIEEEIDPYLEAAAIHRRVHQAGGPAVLYMRVKGSPFPMVSNLFGTMQRTRFIFRDTLEQVQNMMRLRADPVALKSSPWQYLSVAAGGWHTLPKKTKTGPILSGTTTLEKLPQLQSWPDDGGAFLTLPIVYTEDAHAPGIRHSNLGMYRIQISGGRYASNREAGMHYQIHRGIGVHHQSAVEKNEDLYVNIFVGGPPAMTMAAVMPLPEGLPEIYFAGALAGGRIPMIHGHGKLPILAEADFCISGHVSPGTLLPEGPFGDHLGYYSLAHDFPVLTVDRVYCRGDAMLPFTVVGRPPQEDSVLGEWIHELTGPVIPAIVPGVKGVHAVDAAGVHPLMLAIGSERYAPYEEQTRPQEILTQASGILGQGQMSLTKYLMIVSHQDNPDLDIHDIASFFKHLLERMDFRRDLHFHTCTTMDSLDYSGAALHEGSKVVMAAAGRPIRILPSDIPANLRLPDGWTHARVCLPGILVIQGPAHSHQTCDQIRKFASRFTRHDPINVFPWIVIADDSEFTARNLNNFLWVTFTRSDPARDIYGIESFIEHKHWGCRGACIIDARRKPHHAPPLVEDPAIVQKVDELGKPGGPLHGII